METLLPHLSSAARAIPLNRETIQICQQMDRFVTLLRKHGYEAKSYRDSSVIHFNSLEQTQRETIFRQFQKYSDLCAEVDSQDFSFRASKELTARILKKIGVVAPVNFFDTLDQGDIVEIYDANGVQVFRNFDFYEHCTYTLLDLVSYPWYELLERHESITGIIGGHIQTIMGNCNETVPSTVPVHSMREIFSEEKRMFYSKFKYFAPLFSGPGKKTGFICSGALSHIPEAHDNVVFM